MPFLARTIEKKFFAGLAWSLIAIDLPRSDSRLSIFADLEPRSRMQPPCTPAVIRTSNPCSSGLSQRSAIPTPASALPVAIASSSCSVIPPKLTKSTSRLCLAKIPRSFATGAADVQIALANQASVSLRGGPCGPSPLAATRQIRGSPGTYAGAVSARAAPKIPNGATAPKAPANERTERRENAGRTASGRPFVKLLLISRVSIASLPKPCLECRARFSHTGRNEQQ